MGQNFYDKYITGRVSQEDLDKAPQIDPIGEDVYQIKGADQYARDLGALGGEYADIGSQAAGAYGGYNEQLGALGRELPGAPDLAGATAGTMAQQKALQDYFQSIALGQQPTTGDLMFQRAQAGLGKQLQSGLVGQRGMSPALAMRQLFQQQAAVGGDLASRAAIQKAADQQAYGGLAQRGGAQLQEQEFRTAQQDFQNRMSRNAAQQATITEQAANTQRATAARQAAAQGRQNVANGIFDAARTQTDYNIRFNQDRQAYQAMQRAEAQQRLKDEAADRARLAQAIIKGGLTIGGAALGSLGGAPGAMIGGQIGGGLAGAITGGGGGGGGLDPNMLAALMASRNSSSAEPFKYESGLTGQDYNQMVDPTTGELPGSFVEPMAGSKGVY